MDDMLLNGARTNDIEMVKTAVENGAKVSTKAYGNWTPLHYAIKHKNIDMVYDLCQKGALIDVGTLGNGPYNDTELINAVRVDSLPLVKFFVEMGENVNAQNLEGWTPLHVAAEANWGRANSTEIVEYLLANKANVNKVNKFGNTPLMSMVNNNDMYIAYAAGNLEMAKTLLNAGTNTSIKNKNMKTALQIAIDRNWRDMINLLLPVSPKN
ncbi:ankyrin repeat domain-containing protein [Anaerospora hongkongensis]|uniref:ankyrin repeat domain-containing protein n=1 Tax=Anaerospora hongkongensis TaxID=244830 RepID=UPI002899E535|nr:ankyrin repeat domain-containing protein [Anaerospora hongkongensis]